MSEANQKEYSNGEITIIWKPDACIHSANCVRNSPLVFRPKERPWINIDAETSQQIMQAVDKCPSGALSYRIEKQELIDNKTESEKSVTEIEAIKNGPLIVCGTVEIKNSDGTILDSSATTIALCRCGASKDKPFCDGSHSDVNFQG